MVAKRINEFNKEQMDLLPDEGMRKFEDLDDGEKGDLIMEEGLSQQIYCREARTISMAKMRVTNSRLNAHITLPTLDSVEDEAHINLRTGKFGQVARKFYTDSTNEGLVASNLTQVELDGLESIQRRLKKGTMVMLQTDKSGRLCPTGKDEFIEMGRSHTVKDREISRAEAYKMHDHLDCLPANS